MRKLLLVAIVVVDLLAFGFALLVIGDASTLGEAAIIAKSDALAMFWFSLVGFMCSIIVAIVPWRRPHPQLRP